MGQMEFSFGSGCNPHKHRECHFPVHYRGELKFPIDKQKTRGCAQLMKDKDKKEKQHPMNRLAHILCKEELYRMHYDNCKIQWTYGIAHKYCNEALNQGWHRDSIISAYYDSLIDCHGRATDQSMADNCTHRWVNSSTVAGAWKILHREGRMYVPVGRPPKDYKPPNIWKYALPALLEDIAEKKAQSSVSGPEASTPT